MNIIMVNSVDGMNNNKVFIIRALFPIKRPIKINAYDNTDIPIIIIIIIDKNVIQSKGFKSFLII